MREVHIERVVQAFEQYASCAQAAGGKVVIGLGVLTVMDFTKVITHPLGLTGFALALVFGIAGIFARNGSKTPKWLPAVAVALAGVSLVGGLILDHEAIKPTLPVDTAASAQHVGGENVATTQDDCAPAFAGVAISGSMSISCDKSANHRNPAPGKQQ